MLVICPVSSYRFVSTPEVSEILALYPASPECCPPPLLPSSAQKQKPLDFGSRNRSEEVGAARAIQAGAKSSCGCSTDTGSRLSARRVSTRKKEVGKKQENANNKHPHRGDEKRKENEGGPRTQPLLLLLLLRLPPTLASLSLPLISLKRLFPLSPMLLLGECPGMCSVFPSSAD